MVHMERYLQEVLILTITGSRLKLWCRYDYVYYYYNKKVLVWAYTMCIICVYMWEIDLFES